MRWEFQLAACWLAHGFDQIFGTNNMLTFSDLESIVIPSVIVNFTF
jgi:hypothetical protein